MQEIRIQKGCVAQVASFALGVSRGCNPFKESVRMCDARSVLCFEVSKGCNPLEEGVRMCDARGVLCFGGGWVSLILKKSQAIRYLL